MHSDAELSELEPKARFSVWWEIKAVSANQDVMKNLTEASCLFVTCMKEIKQAYNIEDRISETMKRSRIRVKMRVHSLKMCSILKEKGDVNDWS